MGWNVSQANGGLLLVSQFTLMAQTQKAYVQILVQPCRQAMPRPYMNSWSNMPKASSTMYKPVFLQLI